jgi:cytochrome c oxidase subunit 4
MADDDTKKPHTNADDDDEKPGFSEEDEEPKTSVETVDAKKAQRESPVGDFPGSSSPSSQPPSKKTEAAKAPDDEEEDEDEDEKVAAKDGADGADGADDEDDNDDDDDDDDEDEDEDDEEVAVRPTPARSDPPPPKKKPAQDHGHGAHDDHGFAHLVSVQLLGGILAVLLVLTVVTVAAAKVDLGAQLNLIVAMIIATVKAGLVVTFFMHLLWDKKFNTLVFLSSVFFMVLFMSIAMTDRREYQHLIEEREAAQAALK